MTAVSKEDGFGLDDLRNTNPGERGFFDHLFVDGVFVLGKGFVAVDSLRFESTVERAIKQGLPVPPGEIWIQWLRTRTGISVGINQPIERQAALEQFRDEQ